MASTGEFLAQGVDVTLSRQIDLRNGTIEMGGGTLTLEQGGYIPVEGVLDLSNSVLEISGQFKNDGGTLTTSGSTLRLKGNTYLGNGGPVTFATFEPNGWGLKLTDNTTHLTLAGDVLLQPNDESWNNMTDSSSLDFDGTNDYVSLSDGSSLNFGSNQGFTVEASVKTTDNAGASVTYRTPPSHKPANKAREGFNGSTNNNGKVMALIRGNVGGFAEVGGGSVNDDTWHHVALTRNAGNTLELYLDGVSQGTDSVAGANDAITTDLRAVGAEEYWIQTSWATATASVPCDTPSK
jgi:hypothetical protein